MATVRFGISVRAVGRHGESATPRPESATTRRSIKGSPAVCARAPTTATSSRAAFAAGIPGTDWPDEIAGTGEAYFFRSGHVLIYEEETEALELNPAAALQTLMDHIESLAQRFRDSQ